MSLIKTLVSAKASVNAVSHNGRSVIEFYIYNYLHLDPIEFLLEQGASVNSINWSSFKGIDTAVLEELIPRGVDIHPTIGMKAFGWSREQIATCCRMNKLMQTLW